MSLIPSESVSFSDLLGRGLDGSKNSKWRVSPAEEKAAVPSLKEPVASKTAVEKATPRKEAAAPGRAPRANRSSPKPGEKPDPTASEPAATSSKPEAPKRSRLAALVSAVS